MCGTTAQNRTSRNQSPIPRRHRPRDDRQRPHNCRIPDGHGAGQMEGATYWHRLEATRQLAALGIKLPQVVVNAAAKPAKPRTQSAASTRTAPASKTNELAEIVKLETDNGKDVVRFLVDVVCDRVADAKMCHRIAAAKELLRHCSGNILVYSNDGEERDESFDDGDQAPELSYPDSLTYVDRQGNVLNKDHAPFDFDKYGREDYKRDRMGHRAELHIFGGEEALEVALNTAREFGRESRAAGHIGDYDYSPIENPEDDPYGKGCYGYQRLAHRIPEQQCNQSNQQDRGGIPQAKIQTLHKRRWQSCRLGGHSVSRSPRPPVPRTQPPHYWPMTTTNPLMTRTLPRRSLPNAPMTPNPPSSMTPEHAHDPPVGAGFKPARGLTAPPSRRTPRAYDIASKEKTPENPPRPGGRRSRRTIARATAETPAKSEYRSATCCQCQPAPSDRAAKRPCTPTPHSSSPPHYPSIRRHCPSFRPHRPSFRPHYPSSPTMIGDLPPRHSGPRFGTQGTGAATTTTIIPRQHPPTVLPHPDAVPTVGPGWRTRPHHSHVTTTTNPLSPPPSSPTLARHPRPRSGTFPQVIPDADPEPRGRARQPPTTIIPHQHPPTVLPHPDAVPTVGPGWRTRPHHSHVTTLTTRHINVHLPPPTPAIPPKHPGADLAHRQTA